MDESTITAAILGQLIPAFEYASPVLLERVERKEPLIARRSPSDPGFEIGRIDPGLLELFELLVPYVKTALGYGLLGILQTWLIHERGKAAESERTAKLNELRIQNDALGHSIDAIAQAIAGHRGTSTSAQDVVDLFVAAAQRLAENEGHPGRERPLDRPL